MEEQGIGAITTSCGFNSIFQRELADSVNIPVFTSSLMQIPFVLNMIRKQQAVGVITAKKSALSEQHLENVGINKQMLIQIQGMEACTEWNKIFSSPDKDINISIVENDIVSRACSMMERSDIGAFVLECTDLPPFSNAVRKATGRPVFDFVTLTNFVYHGIRNC